MNGIITEIEEGMKQFGYKAKTVSIRHLPEVQEAVGKLVRQGLVNKQLYETWHFYVQTNKNLPEANTIIVVAMPQPITRIWFKWQRTTYLADIPPDYFARAEYESRAEKALKNALEAAGYQIAQAHLALKTLAVRSGLATYGRNNITYIPGMGSLYSLVAFYSDCPCEQDNWQDSKVIVDCENCSLCRESCPTGSIPVDRFLINAENCLGFLNEMEPDIPYWVQLQPDWQNALIGCMRCQFVCPVNKPYLDNIVVGPFFSQEETGLILNKTPFERLPPVTLQKLGISERVYLRLPSNLSALIEKQDKVAGI
jgi:epoxyqueuosine reductase